jgi:hypothetical protein
MDSDIIVLTYTLTFEHVQIRDATLGHYNGHPLLPILVMVHPSTISNTSMGIGTLPTSLMHTMQKILQTPILSDPQNLVFKFEISKSMAQDNANILHKST